MTILLTAGATREPIDQIRYVSNLGTGSTGAAVAGALAVRGHRLVLLRGQGAAPAPPGVESEAFTSAEDLRGRLQARLARGDIEAVVMTAAVADYRPVAAAAGKLSSEAESLTLALVRNPKLLPLLKSYSPRPVAVAGFKLTVGAGPAARREAVAAQFRGGGVDLVVHNDLEEIRRAGAHPFRIYRTASADPLEVSGAAALALALEAEFTHAHAGPLRR